MNAYGFLGPLLPLFTAAAAWTAARSLSRALRYRVGSALLRVLLALAFTCGTTAAITAGLVASRWWPLLLLVAAPWGLVFSVTATAMTCRPEATGRHT
ncbi:hypothetical protein [Streptomyces sp. NPDC002990]